MSETVLIWIFGIMGGWLVILSAGLLHVKMSMAELRTIKPHREITGDKI